MANTKEYRFTDDDEQILKAALRHYAKHQAKCATDDSFKHWARQQAELYASHARALIETINS